MKLMSMFPKFLTIHPSWETHNAPHYSRPLVESLTFTSMKKVTTNSVTTYVNMRTSVDSITLRLSYLRQVCLCPKVLPKVL